MSLFAAICHDFLRSFWTKTFILGTIFHFLNYKASPYDESSKVLTKAQAEPRIIVTQTDIVMQNPDMMEVLLVGDSLP